MKEWEKEKRAAKRYRKKKNIYLKKKNKKRNAHFSLHTGTSPPHENPKSNGKNDGQPRDEGKTMLDRVAHNVALHSVKSAK